ncbi:MAG: hypothetical protein B6242_00760 [Anaerolineaceae bacterium 4572_78]|nr:MAG: hypothetical protein B6242_00760 [Anaerolineaceae bacterium 4572_78]
MLKGTRVTLRVITRDDLPRYVEWLSDIEVTEHLDTYLPFSMDDETDWYEAQRKDSSTHNFAIETETGKHIGGVGLMQIDHRLQSTELGIIIGDKTEWNKGYGKEAIGLVLDFAFGTLNLHRVQLRVNCNHPPAIACYEHSGFVREGELRQAIFLHGKFFNQYIMSVLRNEYT